MFYHNTESDRSSNFITSESLKIELIAGGLNWKQQQYIMEKMEPNDWGDVSGLGHFSIILLLHGESFLITNIPLMSLFCDWIKDFVHHSVDYILPFSGNSQSIQNIYV